jgi:hypothetical protein
MCLNDSVLTAHFITCVNKTNSLLSSQVTPNVFVVAPGTQSSRSLFEGGENAQ